MNKTYSICVLMCVLSMIGTFNITFTSDDPDLFNRDPFTGIPLSEAEREARLRLYDATAQSQNLQNRGMERQLNIEEHELHFERNASTWPRFSHPRNLEGIINTVTISMLNGIMLLGGKVLIEYFTNANIHKKQLIEQEVEFNKIKVEQARYELQNAKKEAEIKGAVEMLNIKNAAIILEEKNIAVLKNKQLLAISAILATFVEKKSSGQALTETEHESYTDYKKILKALSQINDQPRQARIPAGA